MLTGGCLCGRIRYRVLGVPLSCSVCHCRSCRRASGAPSVAWFVVDERQFVLECGQLAEFRSSAPVVRGFCPGCGTPMMYRHADAPARVELTTATLDRPECLPPTHDIWFDEKIPWAASDPALPHLPKEGGWI